MPCERFAAGICEYGQECWFIHDPGNLALLKPPSEISLDVSVNSDGTTTRVGSPPPPPASTPTRTVTPLSARVKAHPCYKSTTTFHPPYKSYWQYIWHLWMVRPRSPTMLCIQESWKVWKRWKLYFVSCSARIWLFEWRPIQIQPPWRGLSSEGVVAVARSSISVASSLQFCWKWVVTTIVLQLTGMY